MQEKVKKRRALLLEDRPWNAAGASARAAAMIWSLDIPVNTDRRHDEPFCSAVARRLFGLL